MLKDVSYTFEHGNLYVLVGKSGSGKSTILHIIANLIQPTSGDLLYKKRRLPANNVTLVLQQPFFFGDISIADNLRISAIYTKKPSSKLKKQLLKVFAIESIQKRLVSLCSGGEKARVNIIRGLLTGKPIILIDEPTAHLDAFNSEKVARVLSQWAKHYMVIVTTHQPSFFKYDNSVFLTIDEGCIKSYDPI